MSRNRSLIALSGTKSDEIFAFVEIVRVWCWYKGFILLHLLDETSALLFRDAVTLLGRVDILLAFDRLVARW